MFKNYVTSSNENLTFMSTEYTIHPEHSPLNVVQNRAFSMEIERETRVGVYCEDSEQ